MCRSHPPETHHSAPVDISDIRCAVFVPFRAQFCYRLQNMETANYFKAKITRQTRMIYEYFSAKNVQ